MKTTKLVPQSLPVLIQYKREHEVLAGYRYEFTDYPGVSWFTAKNPVSKSWRTWEASTGAHAGETFAKTRTGSIGRQFNVLESIRISTKHAGDAASVVRYLISLTLSFNPKTAKADTVTR